MVGVDTVTQSGIFEQKKSLIAKGQLISKCHFGVIVSTKRPTKFAHEIFRLTCVYQVIFLLKDFFFKKKEGKV